MHRLINDVIAFHHLRQQNLTIQLSVFDCRSFVARLCATHRSFATVPMHCVVDDDVPECMISDRMRVAQIVSNGLTNRCVWRGDAITARGLQTADTRHRYMARQFLPALAAASSASAAASRYTPR